MLRYLFTAWFQDSLLPPDDEDFEWPACFIIEAENQNDALLWGRELAEDYCRRRASETLLHCGIDLAEEDEILTLPLVVFGQSVEDEHIGW